MHNLFMRCSSLRRKKSKNMELFEIPDETLKSCLNATCAQCRLLQVAHTCFLLDCRLRHWLRLIFAQQGWKTFSRQLGCVILSRELAQPVQLIGLCTVWRSTVDTSLSPPLTVATHVRPFGRMNMSPTLKDGGFENRPRRQASHSTEMIC